MSANIPSQDHTDPRGTALHTPAERVTSLSLQPPWHITKAALRPLRHLPHLNDLRLWAHSDRAAASLTLQLPALKQLTILALTGPHTLTGGMRSLLEQIYISQGATTRDAQQLLHCQHLQSLTLHSAKLDARFFRAVCQHPALHTLDVEGARLSDPTLQTLVGATCLKTLALSSTNVTVAALQVIASLPQLQSLDLWHTAIPYEAYSVLTTTQSLQHFSVGPEPFAFRLTQEQQAQRIDLLIDQLSAISSLDSVWLDDVTVTPIQQQRLQARFSKVRIDPPW